MAFPTIVERSIAEVSFELTTHAVALPPHSPGSLLIAVVGFDGEPVVSINTASSSSDWSVVAEVQNIASGLTPKSVVYSKIAQNDSEQLVLTTSVAESCAAICYVLGGGAAFVEVASATGNVANNPSPGITPSAGLEDYLFIAALVKDGVASTTAAPAGFGNFQTLTARVSSLVGVSSAELFAATDAQASGNWTATLEQSIAWTIAVWNAAADTLAPTLTTPTATALSDTTASGTVSTNEANGTLYHLTTASDTATATEVKAGASQAVTATGTQTVSITGLTASTAYYTHYLHRDAAGNDSAVSTTAQFTTAAPPVTLTTEPLRNNTGTLLANETGATLHIYEVATGNKVATKTGQTTSASGIMTAVDGSLVSGTEYRVVIVLASGAEGLDKVTAA